VSSLAILVVMLGAFVSLPVAHIETVMIRIHFLIFRERMNEFGLRLVYRIIKFKFIELSNLKRTWKGGRKEKNAFTSQHFVTLEHRSHVR